MKNVKLLCSLLIVFCICFCGICPAYAYSVPKQVRVGLEYKYKEASSIPIVTANIHVGFQQGENFISCTTVSSGSYTILPSDSFYVSVLQRFNTYEQALNASLTYSNRGINALVALKNISEFYLYLGGFSSLQEASSAASANGGTIVNSSNRRIVLASSGKNIIVFDNDTLFPQIASAQNTNISLGDRQYRGVLEFGRYAGAKVTAVNVIGLDEYLCSAVPSEMPESWHLQALKAQAVASRSYMLTRLGVHASAGYQLCDGVHCQNYVGAANEKESTNKAVNETIGIVALYNNQPINAVYHSSSGGVTDNSENVWQEATPYLRSIVDSAENMGKVWTRTFTLNQITNLLSKKGANIGSATNVTIKTAPASGRVLELIIQGTTGMKTLAKEEIRTYFSSSEGGELDSRNFTIMNGVSSGGSTPIVAPALDSVVKIQGSSFSADAQLKNSYVMSSSYQTFPLLSFNNSIPEVVAIGKNGSVSISSTQTIGSGATISSGQNNTIVFSGKGWGHGVGMSQYGAKAMAEAGANFIEILSKYYTNISFANYNN